MTSWRSTLIGALAAATLIGYKLYSGQRLDSTDITAALGLLGIGVSAKDAVVHSTQAEVVESTAVAQEKALAAAQK